MSYNKKNTGKFVIKWRHESCSRRWILFVIFINKNRSTELLCIYSVIDDLQTVFQIRNYYFAIILGINYLHIENGVLWTSLLTLLHVRLPRPFAPVSCNVHLFDAFACVQCLFSERQTEEKKKQSSNKEKTESTANIEQKSAKIFAKLHIRCVRVGVHTIRCVASFVQQFGINDVMIHWNSPLCAPNQFSMDYSACACMWRRRWRCFNFAIAYNMGTMTRVPLNFDWNVSKLLTSGKRKNEHGNTRKTNAETLYRWYRWWAIFCSRYRFYADSRINLC